MTRATFVTSLFVAATVATSALAAGSDSTTPPKPTATTQKCERGQIFDEKSNTCLDAKSEAFDDNDRYDAAREMAYAGQYDNAMNVLLAAADQNDPRILNYKGFTNRKMGNVELAMDFYNRALEIDPDYILARSYMGQGLVKMGDIAGARAQLAEIAERGGEDTWAYAALDQALSGKSTDY